MRRQAEGAPVVIVMPGAVYGPGDHSELGAQVEQAARGKFTIRAFPELGISMSYVDDVAAGMLLAQEKGESGQSYVLGGEVTRLGIVMDTVADLTGNKRARIKVPSPVFQAITRWGRSSAASPAPGPTCAKSSARARTSPTGPRARGPSASWATRRAASSRVCATCSQRAAPELPPPTARCPTRRRYLVQYWIMSCAS